MSSIPEQKAYSYKPLGKPRNIRLIVLQQGNLRSPIHFTLEVASLDSPPDYEAISYCWGDESNKKTVFCGGEIIEVTVNLYAALDRLRFPDRPRVLWADAICIDQKHNLEEKSAQIMLMTDVYSLASQVLIWLGEDTAGTEGVEDLISNALQILPPESVDPEEMQKRIKELSADSSKALRINWDPFLRLIENPWFERKWIVQEVALARQAVLIHGPLKLSWDLVSSLALRMLSYNIIHTISNEEYDFKTQGWQLYNIAMILAAKMYRPAATLLDGIKATKKFISKDPRDQIYGLLGLVTNKQGSTRHIVPDYYSPVEDVYRQFTEDLLIKDKNLSILSLAPSASTPWHQSTMLLPSWVPDLTVQDIDSIAGYTVREGKFSAGGSNVPVISVEPGTSRLVCSGIIFDSVAKVSSCMVAEPDPPVPAKIPAYLGAVKKSIIQLIIRQQHYFKECEELVSGSGGINSLSPERFSAFWKTMICERLGLSNRVTEDISVQFREYFNGIMDVLNENDAVAQDAFARCFKFSSMIEPTLTAMAFSRRLCITSSDRLGQVPRLVEVGDLICVLSGADVPFVIRPTGRGSYYLVGECYISDVMDGELLCSSDVENVKVILE
ncbi:hypothetical protein B7463_g10797, partial [Scytalidium lignicola]